MNPPVVIVHGNSLEHVTEVYKRYLEGFFRDAFRLKGTPLRIEFRMGRNPFAGLGHKDGMNKRTGQRLNRKPKR
jgi:GTP-binding protein